MILILWDLINHQAIIKTMTWMGMSKIFKHLPMALKSRKKIQKILTLRK